MKHKKTRTTSYVTKQSEKAIQTKHISINEKQEYNILTINNKTMTMMTGCMRTELRHIQQKHTQRHID